MALTPKERERIIEEETLRFETRRNLHCQRCAGRPRRWPWVVAGLILVWLLYSRIFCGHGACPYEPSCHPGAHAWMQQDGGQVAPGQPVAPEKAPKN